jgi:hypothetical protein
VSSGRQNGRTPKFDLTMFGVVSDSELLGIVDDLADENGWTSTIAVRQQLGESVTDLIDRRSGVGPRLSWLVRYGWLEKGEPTDKDENTNRRYQTYRLTAMGHALLDRPKLAANFERAFQGLNPAQRLQLTRELAEGGHNSPDEIRVALRRQWQRSLGR